MRPDRQEYPRNQWNLEHYRRIQKRKDDILAISVLSFAMYGLISFLADIIVWAIKAAE